MRKAAFYTFPAVFLLALAGRSEAVPAPAPAIAAPVLDTIQGVRPGEDLDDLHTALKLVGTTHSLGDGEEEGREELWTLRGTPYSQIVVKSDAHDQVLWITGFVRPGQEIAFTRFGDPAKALVFRDTLGVWNVARFALPYRLIARGGKGRARSVSLILLVSHAPGGRTLL